MADLKKFFLVSRLQTKFVLVFIVLAAVPVLTLGLTAVYLIDLSHRRDVSNFELLLIDQKAEEINKFFADTLGILELRVGFTQKSEIESSQQQFLLEGLLEENPAFEEVSFISLSGKETAKKTRDGGEAELQDVSLLSKYQIARSGKNFIGEVSHTLSGPIIALASPVRNRNGEIIQILSAEVNLRQLAGFIEAGKLGFSGYLVLTDAAGALVAPRKIGEIGAGENLADWPRVRQVLAGKILNALEPGDRYHSFFSQTPVVGAGRRIPLTGWAILAEWPLQDADSVILDVRSQVINITLFGVVAVILLAPLFANRLLRPIRELEESAARIEQGNFNKPVEIKTDDELEDLGEAFNKMTTGLKRLQELKNEFVFIAAHELRTPITATKGFISMLLEEGPKVVSKKIKADYINPIWQANERLIQVVDNILEIARSDAGRLKIAVAPCDLAPAVKEILTEIKPLADDKNITLDYIGPQTLPQVLADLPRVNEVLINLLSNAIKYGKEKGWIKIYHEIDHRAVITHVEDNGMGMSAPEQEHIFEKYFRVESAATKVIKGTGLGLFITKELVEKMGGNIWFASHEDIGTRFSFSLPISGSSGI